MSVLLKRRYFEIVGTMRDYLAVKRIYELPESRLQFCTLQVSASFLSIGAGHRVRYFH